MKTKHITIITNIIIVCMLTTLMMFTLSVKTQYAFSHENNGVVYNGNRDGNKVCLMINVYWGNEYIDDILKTLERYNVKTTFFIGGSWANKYGDILEKIASYGHEIANHGYFHKDQDKLDYDANYQEIEMCHKIVKSTIGVDMNLFAPPSGAFNNSTLQASTALGYRTIMWSLDTIDWRDQNVDLIYSRATKKVKGGDLILAHPTQMTLKALPSILDYYASHDLVATTVSDVISVN